MPKPLLWFNDNPNIPIHRIDQNQKIFTLEDFANNPDLQKYHAAYDEYVKSWYSHKTPRSHKVMTDKQLHKTKVEMLKLINQNKSFYTNSKDVKTFNDFLDESLYAGHT